MVLMPVEGDAATTSWFFARSLLTSFVPIRPLPPITTIFIICSLDFDRDHRDRHEWRMPADGQEDFAGTFKDHWICLEYRSKAASLAAMTAESVVPHKVCCAINDLAGSGSACVNARGGAPTCNSCSKTVCSTPAGESSSGDQR